MSQLQLPGFEGPLDLLLQLIERREIDISELSLVQVADQFMSHVDTLKASSVRTNADDPVADSLAEFLSLGGRLMLLKSRRMLPGDDDQEPGEDDPGGELVELLEEHKRYRDAIAMFGTIDRSGLRSFQPGAPTPVEAETPKGLPDTVTLDLLTKLVREALARADERAQRHPEVALQRDPVTVHDKISELQGRLRGGRRVSFRDWIAEAHTRTEVIVTFMAILELYKSRAIEMSQDGAYGDIVIEEKPDSVPLADAVPPEDDVAPAGDQGADESGVAAAASAEV